MPLMQVLPVAEPEGARRVEAIDMRFGSPRQPGFMAAVTLGLRLEVLESSFQFGPVKPR
jgi:hypothetical protein